ncbi:CHRD domain-containing protein [Candidatus Pacearchaeota archaeon]|nr:CHRD domain-containing protein [Candidatus Pacearchaeota archaeon]
MEKLKKIYLISLITVILLVSIVGFVLAEMNEINEMNDDYDNLGGYISDNRPTMSIFKVIRSSATLKESSEVPGTKSKSSGRAEFLIDTQSNRLLFNIVYFGLEGDETGAHIHGPASRRVNAPVLFTLPATQEFKSGVWNYPESLESDILNGKMYVNIHSTKYPNGKIRGQIIKNRLFSFRFNKIVDTTRTHNIEIRNFSFIPDELRIAEGDKVIWINMDSASHTVTSDNGTELNSGIISNGGSYSHVFNNEGDFKYHCQLHPSMHGKIEVKDNY